MRDTKNLDPPKQAIRLMRWYCRLDRQEELEGDLLEMHALRQKRACSGLKLRLLFWWDVIRCFKSYSIRKTSLQMNLALYLSYSTVAIRNARKNMVPVAINVIGMGLALSFCITVYMLYAFNMEFDSCHQNADNIYRLHSIRWLNDEPNRYDLAPLPIVNRLEEEIPTVLSATYYDAQRGTIQLGSEYFSEYIGSVRANFFEHFNFPLTYGSLASIHDPNSLFLSEEVARKYFGTENPVGKTLTMHIGKSTGLDLIVAGVFQKIPLNNTFDFNVLVNHDAILSAINATEESWDSDHNVAVYLKTMQAESTLDAIQQYLPEQNIFQENWKVANFDLWAFHDDRFSENNISYSPANERIEKSAIIVFTALAILILLVACFNLANTGMAMMSKRVKEIGIRKTLGTTNKQLFMQFMFEMLITSSLALVIALLLTNTMAENIWGLFGVSFFLQDVSIIRFIPFILSFLLICTFLAGLLPAIYAWKFSPMRILQGKHSLKGVSWFQKFLTIGQYSVSICLLVSAWASSQNSEYFKSIDLGYNYEQIVMIPIDDPEDFTKLQNELQQLPSTDAVVGTPDHHGNSYNTAELESDTTSIEVAAFLVSPSYMATMEIETVAGRDFIEGSTTDLEKAVIVNEEFARQYLDPKETIAQKININGEDRVVVGVVADIIHELYAEYEPRPTVYLPGQAKDYRTVIAKTTHSGTEEYEHEIKQVWAGLFDSPYRGKAQKMVDSALASRDARNLKIILLCIATLGSILSLMGIYSLASLNVSKRTKEISIRRILGARIDQVMLVINKSFVSILMSSLVIGVASGIFLTDMLLGVIYAFYANASIIESIIIGLGVLLAAFLFIVIAVAGPASANPSEGLRTE